LGFGVGPPTPNPQSPIPNPQSPIFYLNEIINNNINLLKNSVKIN
jgi:hypothetical protein